MNAIAARSPPEPEQQLHVVLFFVGSWSHAYGPFTTPEDAALWASRAFPELAKRAVVVELADPGDGR